MSELQSRGVERGEFKEGEGVGGLSLSLLFWFGLVWFGLDNCGVHLGVCYMTEVPTRGGDH